jgi:hypothetical protein
MSAGSVGGLSSGAQAQMDALNRQKEQEILKTTQEGIKNEIFTAKKTNADKLRF